MSSPAEQLIARVRDEGLLQRDGPVVALISGGRDSTCLLDVCARVAGAAATTALHVNYGLRDEAAADESHCRVLCEQLGVALVVERAGARPSGNMHAWARDLRYGVARALAADSGAEIATGHTSTDQVETVLYRLASSPGRRALLGMRAREGDIVRPLLGFTRAETAAYCNGRGLPWREDVSNEDPNYARARVRGALVPALEDIHPAAEANVLRTVAALRDEAEVLDAAVDAVLDGAQTIELERLARVPQPLARLVLRELVERAAGGLAPASAGRLDEVLALGGRGGSASIDLGGGVRAIVEYGVLRIGGAVPAPPAAVELPVPGSVRFDGWEVRCEEGPPQPRDGLLDADTLRGGLTVRSWRAGDRMRPVGLGGSKTLQDLFTDRRVPRERRATLPVVEADGEIAWVAGVATDERFGVTAETSHALRLSATPRGRA